MLNYVGLNLKVTFYFSAGSASSNLENGDETVHFDSCKYWDLYTKTKLGAEFPVS